MQPANFIVALIRKSTANGIRWLGILNPDQRWWDFMVCPRLEHESIQELLGREVAWRLELDRNQFLIASTSQLHVNPIAENANPDSNSEVELIFNSVDIVRSSAIDQLDARDDCCWLSASELCAGVADDGTSINPQLTLWLNRWRIIQPWE